MITPASASKKYILSFSEHIFKDTEEAGLMKYLHFLVTYPHSNLDALVLKHLVMLARFVA
jgi:hypothetical protein